MSLPNSPFRGLAKRVGLAGLAVHAWHRPREYIRRMLLEGGPLQQSRTARGHECMRKAAMDMPALIEPRLGPQAKVNFLSGSRFWHQTLFCMVSLQILSPFKITPVVFDDGSLDQDTKTNLSRVIPWIQFIDASLIESRLDSVLPNGAFPSLRQRRRDYIHLRKLIDIHVCSTDTCLIMDSDMLFFRYPHAVLEWFESPHALYMQDVSTAYGYPLDFLNELAGATVPERLNVGLYSLGNLELEWDQLEFWCRRQLDAYGPSYFQEQALTAMLFAKLSAKLLPRRRYIVQPDLREGRAQTAVLHHYVAQSKRSYFQYGWRRILEERTNMAG